MHPFFFFNDTATTEIYTLSLHDALPICEARSRPEHLVDEARHAGRQRQAETEHEAGPVVLVRNQVVARVGHGDAEQRSEEHTSELQSLAYLVCRLLLEKKKTTPRHLPAI